jgi:hypothetical protein
MLFPFVRDARLLVCMVALLCSSCLSMTVPKSARMDPGSNAGGAPADKRIVDTWELLYEVHDNGDKNPPKEGTRTLIEFTDKGRVIFNRIDKEHSDRVANRTGKYVQRNNEVAVTDDEGNTVTWPYSISGDAMILNPPDRKVTWHLRRFR